MQNEHISETLKPIVNVIGRSATVSLVSVYGGTRLYFPKHENIGTHHPVARVIGLPLAQALCKEFGGEAIELPKAMRITTDQRDAEILRRKNGGEKVADIARDLGMTERGVRKRLQMMRQA
jgi:Mor family transcriptional regulator